jgi:4a-hydroxytetrahydrobiopterin dehydratase
MTDLLNPDALQTSLNQLDGWEGTTEKIRKTYDRGDFDGAMRFVNQVAEIANRRNHHPDIWISWSTVRLEVASHAAGGVTEDCVELARAIDAEAVSTGA